MKLNDRAVRGGFIIACSLAVALTASFVGSRAAADEVLFDELRPESDVVLFDFDSYRDNVTSVGLVTQGDIDDIGDAISARLPSGTQFLRDTRGVGPHVFSNRARFLSVKTPLVGDKKNGLYLSIGIGRDKDMRRASNRRFANKIVVGARMDIGHTGKGRARGEMFAEYRQVQGMDMKGFRGAEQQVSFGIRINF